MHAHAQTRSQHRSLKGHAVAWKQKHREGEIWKGELRRNREDVCCPSSAMATINCSSVNCWPVMCAEDHYSPYLCLSSLRGSLWAQTLTVDGDERQGERHTQCKERAIFPLTFRSMNFHLYLFRLPSRGASASASSQNGSLFSPTIWRTQTAASVANEKNNFPGWTVRNGVNRSFKEREICFIAPAEEVFGDRWKAAINSIHNHFLDFGPSGKWSF